MAEYVRWDPRISLGVKEIDLEHQVFVVIINELNKHQQHHEMATRIVEALVKYAAFHFQSEENIMFATGYPELATHRSTHLHLLEDLSIVLVELKTETLHDYEKILAFFKNWYVNHTSKADLHFAEYLKEQALIDPKIAARLTSPALSGALLDSHSHHRDLSALPPALLARFEATLRHNQTVLQDLIGEIPATQPEIAAMLGDCVTRQDYATLTALLQAAQSTQSPADSSAIRPPNALD